MPIKIQCPQCHRSLTVTADDAGRTAMCSACGSRIAVPFFVVLQRDEGDTVDLDQRFAVRQWLNHSGSGKRYRIGGVRATPIAFSPTGALLMAVAICGGLIAAAVWPGGRREPVVVVPPATAPSIAATNSEPAWDLLTQADDLAVAGQWDEADQAYTRLERYLDAHPVRDTLLLEQLNHEKLRHNAVRESLAMRERSAVPPPSPPAVEPTPVAVTPSPTTAPVESAAHPVPPPPAVVERMPVPRPLHVEALRMPPPDITDQQIGVGIKKAADWVIRQFDPITHELRGPEGTHDSTGTHNALDALCAYALMQAGLALPDDDQLDIAKPFMHQLIRKLTALPMEDRVETYGRGLRATALALADRKEYHDALQRDVGWLLRAHKNGAYSYGDAAAKSDAWDNSNTQYGQLGIWSAAEVGVEIPGGYWRQVEKHWNENQNPDGSWGYTTPSGEGTLSMTSAGVASLFVAHDYLDPADLAGQVGRPPFTKALAKGLAWFESGDNVLSTGQMRGYTLYGVERVGLASGFKFFGSHDWYRELSQEALGLQGSDGSWDNDPVETSYMLLFLARGRHPIIMNKLRFDGYWANRPRDAANLAKFASHELERPLNWQVVSIDRPWQDWADSPILYLASHKPVPLTPMEIGQIRRFVAAGGMLFTHADGGQQAFNEFAVELAQQLFPAYQLVDAPQDSELYSTLYAMKTRPRLQIVTNGARLLMVHSPTDQAVNWQQRASQTHAAAFDLGVNLFLYASGKVELKNRLASPVIPQPPQPTGGLAKVALLRYGPEPSQLWQPEPEAWPRFSKWFDWQTGCGVDLQPLPMDELTASVAPLAELCGAAAFKFNENQAKAIHDYVDAGGTLLIDCAGGSAAFADSAVLLLNRAFPDASLKTMSSSHPLLSGTAGGMEDLSTPRLRAYVLRKLGSIEGVGALEYLPHGHGRVIFSKLDLTEGMLGTRSWGVMGYEPEYAQSLVKNLILWVCDGAPEPRNATAAR